MAANDGSTGGASTYPEVLDRLREIGLLEEQSLLAETAELFLTDAASTLVAMQEAFASGDSGSLERAAHRLKGAALNLGVASIAEPTRHLEANARRGEFAGGPEALAAVERELDSVGRWLRGVASSPLPPS